MASLNHVPFVITYSGVCTCLFGYDAEEYGEDILAFGYLNPARIELYVSACTQYTDLLSLGFVDRLMKVYNLFFKLKPKVFAMQDTCEARSWQTFYALMQI